MISVIVGQHDPGGPASSARSGPAAARPRAVPGAGVDEERRSSRCTGRSRAIPDVHPCTSNPGRTGRADRERCDEQTEASAASLPARPFPPEGCDREAARRSDA